MSNTNWNEQIYYKVWHRVTKPTYHTDVQCTKKIKKRLFYGSKALKCSKNMDCVEMQPGVQEYGRWPLKTYDKNFLLNSSIIAMTIQFHISFFLRIMSVAFHTSLHFLQPFCEHHSLKFLFWNLVQQSWWTHLYDICIICELPTM